MCLRTVILCRDREARMGGRGGAALACLALLGCLGGRRAQPPPRAGHGGGGWGTADNVRAAIDHYGPRVRAAGASADDYKHLATALRFAGRLEECAAVVRQGIGHVPAFATGANYFLLANVLRAVGRPRDAASMYEVRAGPAPRPPAVAGCGPSHPAASRRGVPWCAPLCAPLCNAGHACGGAPPAPGSGEGRRTRAPSLTTLR